jgi:hypothetical protein
VEVLGNHNLAADLIARTGVRELLFVAGLELGFE